MRKSRSISAKSRQRKPSIIPNYKTKAGGAIKVKSPCEKNMSPMQIRISACRNPTTRFMSNSRSL